MSSEQEARHYIVFTVRGFGAVRVLTWFSLIEMLYIYLLARV